ncbi:MAG: GGDEF domain-containing protein [bacterium]|nr:GGDEF domain-containing protein [bacterium]
MNTDQETKEKLELLRNVDIFSSLNEDELLDIAEFSKLYSYKKGNTIFREETIAECMYVIQKGDVNITKALPNGERIPIANFIPGDEFGELDLFEGADRNTTAFAEEDTVLLQFPHKGTSLSNFFDQKSSISRTILHTLLSLTARRIRTANKLLAEKSQWVQDLRKMILIDKLTGLYNRTYLDEDFAQQLENSNRSTALLIIKPDNFKIFNDTFGHDGGDDTLRLLARTVSQDTVETATPIRYHGNVFAQGIIGITKDEAKKIAEELRTRISATDTTGITGGENIPIVVSIGVAVYPEDGSSCNNVSEKAFDTMMLARNDGGDRVYLY